MFKLRRRSVQASPAAETLEIRTMPAVTLSVSGTTLKMVGDDSANNIQITKENGEFVVRSIAIDGLVVNGDVGNEFRFTGIANLKGQFGDYTDTVTLTGLNLKSIDLQMGGNSHGLMYGVDTVTIASSQVTGQVKVTDKNMNQGVVLSINTSELNNLVFNSSAVTGSSVVIGTSRVTGTTSITMNRNRMQSSLVVINQSTLGALKVRMNSNVASFISTTSEFKSIDIDTKAFSALNSMSTVTVNGAIKISNKAEVGTFTLADVTQLSKARVTLTNDNYQPMATFSVSSSTFQGNVVVTSKSLQPHTVSLTNNNFIGGLTFNAAAHVSTLVISNSSPPSIVEGPLVLNLNPLTSVSLSGYQMAFAPGSRFVSKTPGAVVNIHGAIVSQLEKMPTLWNVSIVSVT